ncbi:MAG: SpoIIE family protein phosphatase [Planctomycetota bacterium]|nr:SpoIIE family protein phosphatase [Planctomycetota bacterium]
MAYLLVLNGPGVGNRLELTRDAATIGRQSDCEVALTAAERVSRHHARIVREGDSYFVVDLGSRNGTFVNDIRVEHCQLQDDDRLTLSDMVLVFKMEVPGQDPPPRDPSAKSIVDPNEQMVDSSGLGMILVADDSELVKPAIATSKVGIRSTVENGRRTVASMQSLLDALIEITQSLGKALALDEVLPQVLNGLFNVFNKADRGFIVLRAPNGNLVPRWKRVRGVADEEEPIRISQTILKTVMDSKEAILSADATCDERLQLSQSISALRLRSVMCAPLLDSEGNPLGAIQLDTQDKVNKFQPRDLEVLASVAVQAGIAIHNAQLHENALRQKEIEHDLNLACQVQKSFLPQHHPQLPGYDFHDFYQPANHVGGDYYDYIALPDGRTAVVVGDVVGHGFAAAMLMANLAAEAKYFFASEANPAKALSKLNDRLGNVSADRFITFLVAVLDPVTHRVTLVNAGHNLPIWRRSSGELVEPGMDVVGLPLGITTGCVYRQETITLEVGEALFMYTDGINEAMDPAGEQYTIDRLRRHVAEYRGTLRTVSDSVISDLQQFVGSGSQTDDMCLVGLARK